MAQWIELLGDTLSLRSVLTIGDTLVVGTTQGEVLFSDDLGMTWESRSGNLPVSGVRHLTLGANDRLFCSTSQKIWFSDDWQQWADVSVGGSDVNELVSQQDTILAALAFSGGVLASFDNGNSWTNISSNASGSQYSTSVSIRSDSILWSRFGSGVLRTTDFGQTWTNVPGLGNTMFALSPDGKFVGNDNKIFRSSGNAWASHTTNWQVLDIKVEYPYVAAGGNSSEIILSPDMGYNWLHIPVSATWVGFSQGYLFAAGLGLFQLDIDNYLNISEIAKPFRSVYPGADPGTFIITDGESLDIEVFNISGALVLQDRGLSLDISNQSSGIYIVRLRGKEYVWSQKIVR